MALITKIGDMKAFSRGFTLIELMVVMVIISILLTIVTPRYFNNIEKAKEAVLKEDLAGVRNALDKFYDDTGAYPSNLSELVSGRYIHKIPVDPFTENEGSWTFVNPSDESLKGIYDIHSGSLESDANKIPYSSW